MGIIRVEGIRTYSYHGCLAEEATIGGSYVVDVMIETDFNEAAISDELSKTVDYLTVHEIVKEQMAIRSKLIEHVAKRISDKLRSQLPAIQKLQVTVTKINPPMNGDVEKVSVTVS